MRIPIAVSLESRDGGVTKDAKIVNGVVEKQGDSLILRKRQGTSDLGLVKAGTSQHLTVWNGIKAIIGDYMNQGTISTIVSAPTQTNLSPTNAGLQFTSAYTTGGAATPRLFFKNRSQGWVVNRSGVISSVTYASNMGAGTYTLISLTRTSGTATATLAEDVFNVGDSVTIAGATPVAYNGAQTITAVTAGSSSPATTVSISSLTRSGTTATATTASAHGLTTSTAYAISGANETAYNGSYTITVTGTTTFTYTVTVTPGPTLTWDAAKKATAITLSGGSLTATSTLGGGLGSVLGTGGVSSGKYYWEITVNSGGSCIGIGTSSTSVNVNPAADAAVWVWFGGSIWHNGSSTAFTSSFFAGDVVGVALDMDSGVLYFFKNNVFQGAATTGLSGTYYPLVGVTNDANSYTANFGATAFVYSAPALYSPLQTDAPKSPASGTPIVTKPGSTINPTFSFTIGGSPATPATGTITAASNGGTVPGIPYIDGYFFVMDTNGVIWASNSDDPTTWGALNFTTANAEPGVGRALGRSRNYLIALKEWSCEPYSNAAGAQFPFAPVPGGFTLVGCANGDSLAEVEGNLLWVAQTKYAPGRSVYMQAGLQQQKISTPDVERILNGDLLTTVYAYGLNLDGHALYVLTLTNSNITLVYDIGSGVWMQWSSYTIAASKSVSTITRAGAGSTATVTTSTAHGLSDGDPVKISGANQSEYNGIFQAHVTSTTAFEIRVSGSPTSPATGTILAFPYTESYFKYTKAANYSGSTLLLHETDGHLYQFSSALKQDAGLPINWFARTTRLDGGALEIKRAAYIRVIGDTVSDLCMVRWSNDDCATFKNYRFIDLSLQQPEVRRCGVFRRRVIELRHVGNSSPTLTALEMEIK